MSLLAYAFGGALEGAGKGLAQVGEHRRRMEGERLREEFWEKQNQFNRDAQNTRNQSGIDAQNARNQAGIDAQNDRHQAGITAQGDEAAARRKAQTAQAVAKQAAEKEKGGAARRQDALDLAIKTSKITDDNNNEVIDWNAVGYKMKFWENNDERLPLSRAVTWNDIKVTAEAEGISLEEARDRYRNLGHPVPLGDPPPPPHLANPGGEHAGSPLASPPPKRLWPGRKRYSYSPR